MKLEAITLYIKSNRVSVRISAGDANAKRNFLAQKDPFRQTSPIKSYVST